MEDHAPTNDAPTNGSAAEQPPAAIALTGADAGGSLTNTDIAALSRERQQTLLSILPPAVAAILIANRPPMPPHVEDELRRATQTRKPIATPRSHASGTAARSV